MKERLIPLFLLVSSLLCAQSGQKELILSAESAFKEGSFGKAANLYQEAAIRGVVNGALYYNQGNSWYMAGETNRALLSYLKAEALAPGDGDIKKNLSFLRAQSGEDLSENGGGEFLRVLFFWHFDISTKTRMILFIFANGFFWTVLILAILFKGKGRDFFRICLPILGMAAFSLSLSLYAENYQLNHHPRGVILSETTARKGDGVNFEEAFNRPLEGGTEFILQDKRGDWYHIKLKNGTDGWILKNHAGLVSFP